MLVYRCLHGLAPSYLADDLTTRGRSRIEAKTSFVIIGRARRPTNTSLHRRRPSLSGFSCSRLKRTAGTRHIVAVATHIQTPFEDISFLTKFFLLRFATDTTNNYHHCISVHVEHLLFLLLYVPWPNS